MRTAASALGFMLALCLGAYSAHAALAVPVDPIAGILAAFQSHDIVALGEGRHGNLQGATFRLALIRDPRFAVTVNDIVVECGNSRYQAVVDRFTSGADVPRSLLRQVWLNTTQPDLTCDRPIYEELFDAVRAVNSKLPRQRRIRVLLGDPPIDWAKIQSAADLLKVVRVDDFPAKIVEREVLAKHRRALVIYGDVHFWRRRLYFPLKDTAQAEKDFDRPLNSIVTLLEAAGTRPFSITTQTAVDLAQLQPDVASWPRPSLSLIHDTPLGETPFTFYYPSEMIISHEGQAPEHVRADAARSPSAQEQFDAVLYLGPPASITMSRVSPALCADSEYVKMRTGRLAMFAKLGLGDAAELKKECEPRRR